jgi:hypothetical protein
MTTPSRIVGSSKKIMGGLLRGGKGFRGGKDVEPMVNQIVPSGIKVG